MFVFGFKWNVQLICTYYSIFSTVCMQLNGQYTKRFFFKKNLEFLTVQCENSCYPLNSLQAIGVQYFCMLSKLTLVYEQFFPVQHSNNLFNTCENPDKLFLWNSSATHFSCKNTSDKEKKNKKEQIFNMELSVSISFSS